MCTFVDQCNAAGVGGTVGGDFCGVFWLGRRMDKQQQALMEAFPDLKNLQFPLSDEKLAEILEEIKKREDLPRPPRADPPAFGEKKGASIPSKHLDHACRMGSRAVSHFSRSPGG